MFLQIVPLAGDVAHRALTRAQLDPRHLPYCRVRLLRLGREDFGADALLLEVALEKRSFNRAGDRLAGAVEDLRRVEGGSEGGRQREKE